MSIRNAEDLLAALTVEKSSITTYKTELGFSGQDIADNEQDQANLQTALDNMPIAAADKESSTQVKDGIYNGNPKETVSPYPAFALTPLPFPSAMNGALTRYKSRKTRGMASANYTTQIGEAMGYENAKSSPISPDSVKPTLEAFPAAIAYLVSLIVGNRGGATMWEIQMRRKGEESWQTVKNGTGKSADVTITPTTPGQPEQIQLRVILYKNNQIYGQPSDAVTVTVNP